MTGSFDDIAGRLAECIDEIMQVERSRDRRIALIHRQVRHAMSVAYRAGRGRSPEEAAA